MTLTSSYEWQCQNHRQSRSVGLVLCKRCPYIIGDAINSRHEANEIDLEK